MKKILLVLDLSFVISIGFSQSFMHGAGVVTFIQSVPGSDVTSVGGFTYSPRFNFLEMENSSLSVGVPISIGISGSANYNSQTGSSSSFGFAFDAPLIVNFNVGCGSTKESESRFGFFAGGGFGYHYGTASATDSYGNSYSTTINATGPIGNAGVRIGVGRGTHNIEIKLSYLKGIDVSKADIIGIHGIFNF
jgi:hypothetical protein